MESLEKVTILLCAGLGCCECVWDLWTKPAYSLGEQAWEYKAPSWSIYSLWRREHSVWNLPFLF